MVSVGVHLLRICGRRFKRSIPSLLDLLGCIVHTYHDLCQKFRAILLLTFDFPRHSKYTDREHWKCCYLSQLSQNRRIAATWKWHQVSVEVSVPLQSMSFDLFLNFQCLQILSIYIMHLRKILPWNPHQWFFECPNFQPVFRETFPFFQFPNSFVVGLVYTVQVYPPIVFFTNLTTKLSPKLFSQHRMICLIILLHLRMPRWDRFWSWTRDFLKMDLTWEVAIHPALNEVVQLYEEFLA